MRIYVDMDDVISETAAGLCELAARSFGRRVPYEKVFQFDLKDVFGFTDAEMREFMRLSHLPETLAAYRVTPGAPRALRALAAAGHEIEIVTGRPSYAAAGTRAWLEAAGLGELPVSFVDKYGRANVYQCGGDAPPTVPLAEFLTREYDVAIDDSPSILPRLAQWKRTRVFVFDRPWNRAYQLAANMARVSGWADIRAQLGCP